MNELETAMATARLKADRLVGSDLAAALVSAQQKLPAVPKKATVSTGKFTYSYATLDSLISATLPILNAHGLAITQAPEVIDGIGFGLRTTLHHIGGETVSNVMPIPHTGHSMQDLGGAITYARRYAWSSLLGIASEHDDDAFSISGGGTNGTTDGNRPAATPRESGATVAASSPTEHHDTDPHGLKSSRADHVPLAGKGGSALVPFGKHSGKQVSDVPKSYWAWWLSQEQKTDALIAFRAQVELFLLGTDGVATEVPESEFPF